MYVFSVHLRVWKRNGAKGKEEKGREDEAVVGEEDF